MRQRACADLAPKLPIGSATVRQPGSASVSAVRIMPRLSCSPPRRPAGTCVTLIRRHMARQTQWLWERCASGRQGWSFRGRQDRQRSSTKILNGCHDASMATRFSLCLAWRNAHEEADEKPSWSAHW